MKTDELIDMLSTNVEPVKGAKPRNLLMIALAVGANLAPGLRLGASLVVFVIGGVVVRALARDEIAAVADFLRRRSVQPER